MDTRQRSVGFQLPKEANFLKQVRNQAPFSFNYHSISLRSRVLRTIERRLYRDGRDAQDGRRPVFRGLTKPRGCRRTELVFDEYNGVCRKSRVAGTPTVGSVCRDSPSVTGPVASHRVAARNAKLDPRLHL